MLIAKVFTCVLLLYCLLLALIVIVEYGRILITFFLMSRSC